MNQTKSPFDVVNVRQFIAFRVFFNCRFYYPVFTILFLDLGLTLSQFALLNVAWAITIVLLEVPSGAMADIIGRRKLMVTAGVLMVVEMSVLAFMPRGNPDLLFAVFLVNRVLSGAAEAAASGADEALAYDALKIEGDVEDWGRVLDRQIRYRSLASILAMTIGAAVYDPALVRTFIHWLGWDVTITQETTLRFPLYLTLLMALLTLRATIKMREIDLEADEDGPHDGEPLGKSIVRAFRLTFRAGRWILQTPFALVIILAGLMFDHVLRLQITLSSQYYRLIELPEASYGLISSARSVMGLFVPAIALAMVRRYSPTRNFFIMAALAFVGLYGLTFFLAFLGADSHAAFVLYHVFYPVLRQQLSQPDHGITPTGHGAQLQGPILQPGLRDHRHSVFRVVIFPQKRYGKRYRERGSDDGGYCGPGLPVFRGLVPLVLSGGLGRVGRVRPIPAKGQPRTQDIQIKWIRKKLEYSQLELVTVTKGGDIMTEATKNKNGVKIILGTMTFAQQVNDALAKELIDMFLDAGHLHIDTAYKYVDGLTEELLGRVLTPSYREKIHLATKAAPGDGGGLSPENLKNQVETSLKRLKTDWVDLLYLHMPDPDTPVEASLAACQELRDQGKFLDLGLSNYSSWQVADICHICQKNGWPKPMVYQGMYNAVTRVVEGELFPALDYFDLAFYAYNPLAGGFLTGKHLGAAKVPDQGRFAVLPFYKDRYWKEAYFDAQEQIRAACAEAGLTMVEAAFRYLVHHSGLKAARGDGVILGISTAEQLAGNLAAVSAGPLPEPITQAMDAAWTVAKQDAPIYYR